MPEPPDTVTPLYRDRFGAGTDVETFLALSVPRRGPRGPVRVVKVLVEDLDTPSPGTFFIDTARNETHWWFARELLGDRWSVRRFAQRTYHRPDRPAAALNLVLHLGLTVEVGSLGHAVSEPITAELGEEDAMSPEMALRVVSLLQQRISWARPDTHRLLWLPPDGPSEAATAAHAEAFRSAGVGWMRRAELLADTRLQILNPGLAYGTLRRLDPEQMRRTVVSSRDVLLLDRVPNELPVVAGVISATLQTPLSHVSIASRARGTPDVAVPGASDDPALAALLGRLVRLEVTDDGWSISEVDPAEAAAFWAAGRGAHPEPAPADLSREGLLDLGALTFGDSDAVGAKAANVAELHRLLGPNAPDGFAVPFARYDAFVRRNPVRARLCRDAFVDCAEEGRTRPVCTAALTRCTAGALAGLSLRDYALAVLDEPAVRGDPPLREAVLDGLRYQIGHTPLDRALGEALDAEVERRWGEAPVRLRSSTNTEDLPDFSGAGLYRSVSASVRGRRPSDRIRDVWASAWTYRAVEERAAWGIAHGGVQVAVLVHPATRGETANGVIVTADLHGDRPDAITLNLAPDDRAVANPEGGDLPEQLVVWLDGGELRIERLSWASGRQDRPVLADAELRELHALALAVRDRFAALYGRPLALDLEIKRTAEGRLLVKQARPFPEREAP